MRLKSREDEWKAAHAEKGNFETVLYYIGYKMKILKLFSLKDWKIKELTLSLSDENIMTQLEPHDDRVDFSKS